jgi:hypothetical protein
MSIAGCLSGDGDSAEPMAATEQDLAAACSPTCGGACLALDAVNAGSDTGTSYVIFKAFAGAADQNTNGRASSLRLFENGNELGPAHSNHNDVRTVGKGRFSHWSGPGGTGEGLHFSASDNSNPKTNGRGYAYCLGRKPDVSVKNFGAVGDGIHDDTKAFNDAVKALPLGGTLFVPSGTYLINAVGGGHSDDRGVQLKSNMTFKMADGAVLKTKPNTNSHSGVLNIYRLTDVTVLGGKLVGDRASHMDTPAVLNPDGTTRVPAIPYVEFYKGAATDQHEWGMGLSVLGSKNITVDGLRATEATGDGFWISSAGANLPVSTNLKFLNVLAEHNRRTGLSVTQVDGMLIENSTFSRTEGTPLQRGIDIEVDRSTEEAKNITVRRSMFVGNKSGSIVVFSGSGTNFSGLLFERNSFFDVMATGVEIGSPNAGVKSVVVRSNFFKDNFWGVNVRGPLTTLTQVTNNTFCNLGTGAIRNDGAGVALNTNFEGNTVTGNVVSCTAP